MNYDDYFKEDEEEYILEITRDRNKLAERDNLQRNALKLISEQLEKGLKEKKNAGHRLENINNIVKQLNQNLKQIR